jgi:hypothetical protein
LFPDRGLLVCAGVCAGLVSLGAVGKSVAAACFGLNKIIMMIIIIIKLPN